jgi:hypothetical protein
MAHAICASTLSEASYTMFKSNPSDYVYNRFFETKYWDAYRATAHICMFDDFGQAKDIAGNPDSEIMNWIRAINCFRDDLHMADLASKGVMQFNCKFAIATTNLQRWDQLQSIHDPKAVERRAKFHVVVCPKLEYASDKTAILGPWGRVFKGDLFDADKPVTDKVLLSTMLSNNQQIIHHDMVEFHVVKDSELTGEVISFDTLLQRVIRTYKKNSDWFENQKALVKEVEDRYRKQYSKDVIPPPLNDTLSEDDCDLAMLDLRPEGGVSDDELRAFGNKFFKIDEYCVPEELVEYRDDIRYGGDFNYSKFFDKDTVEFVRLLADKLSMRASKGTTLRFVHEMFCRLFLNWKNFYFFGPYDMIAAIIDHFKGGDNDTDGDRGPLWFNCVTRGEEFFQYFVNSTTGYSTYFEFTASNLDAKVGILDSLAKKFSSLFWILVQSKPVLVATGWIMKAIEFCRKNLFYLTIIPMASGILYLIGGKMIGFFQTFFVRIPTDYFKTPESKDWSKDIHSKVKTSIFTSNNAPKVTVSNVLNVAEGGLDDPNGFNSVMKFQKTNSYVLKICVDPDADKWSEFGTVFFIKGTICVMPLHFAKKLHYYYRCDPNSARNAISFSSIEDRGVGKVYLGTISDIICNTYGSNLIEQDLCIVCLPDNVIQPCKNRLDVFLTDSDVTKMSFNKVSAMLPLIRNGSRVFVTCVATEHKHMIPVTNVSGADLQPYTVRRAYSYDSCTKFGDCGAPLCVMNSAIATRKIIGFHAIGDGKYSYATICTREMLEKALLELDNVDTCDIDISDFDAEFTPEAGLSIGEGQYNTLGRMIISPPTPSTTAIRKSILHNTYATAVVKPALLYTRDGIDPMANALSKYCKNNSVITGPFLEDIIGNLTSEIMRTSADTYCSRRSLTIWEAVYGIDTDSTFKGIAMHTSAGYPMNCPGVENMKKNLLPPPKSEIREDDPNHSFWRLYDLVNIDLEYIKSGKRSFYVFTDFPKDELRPIEKADSGKTRLISGCPLIYYILVVMKFGYFSRDFMHNRINNGSAVGINPYSAEWQKIVDRLSMFCPHDKKSLLVGAGDYSGFDASQPVCLQNAVLRIIKNYYGNDGDNSIRDILWLEVTNAKHVNSGILYEWKGSLSSGHPLTVIINSIINKMCFQICWKLICPELNYFDHVREVVYGDDVIYSVHPHYRAVFNDFTISKRMKSFGFTFTNELKTESLECFRPIEEVEFLKRGFRFEPWINRWVAPLRLSVILNIPMWTKKGSQAERITIDNISVCFRELSLHGLFVFQKWSELIKKEMYDTPLNFDLASDDILTQCYTNILIRVCGYSDALQTITPPRPSAFYDFSDIMDSSVTDVFGL